MEIPSMSSLKNKVMAKLSTNQMVLLAVLVFYFIFPVTFPHPVYQALESLPGMVFLFCGVVYLFLYSHPILGVFSLLAIYEFTRKSTLFAVPQQTVLDYQAVPVSQEAAATAATAFVPSVGTSSGSGAGTLEEDMVNQFAPIGQSPGVGAYVDTPFHPVATEVGSAYV